MSSVAVDCEERVETSTKWCNTHKTKSYFKLFDCPLFFLFWPELPILLPDASREPLEEVFELCELCGQSYKPDSLPVEGLQVGVTKVSHDRTEMCTSKETFRRRCHVTFAPCEAVESDMPVNNGSSGGEEETEEKKLIRGQINGVVTNLKGSEKAKHSAEDEGEYNSDDEESSKIKNKCLPFRKKKN